MGKTIITYIVNAIHASSSTVNHLNPKLQFFGSSGSNGSKSRMTSPCLPPLARSSVMCLSSGCSSSIRGVAMSSGVEVLSGYSADKTHIPTMGGAAIASHLRPMDVTLGRACVSRAEKALAPLFPATISQRACRIASIGHRKLVNICLEVDSTSCVAAC
jgi:hypothetical protein